MAIGKVSGRDVIVAASQDVVRMWDAVSRNLIRVLHGREYFPTKAVVTMNQAGSKEMIVTNGYDNTLLIWNAVDGSRITDPLTGHTGDVTAVAIGQTFGVEIIASGSFDRTVRLWNANTGTSIGRPLIGHRGAVSAVALGRVGDRDIVVSGSDDKTIRIWDVASCKELAVMATLDPVEAVAIDGDRLVVAAGIALSVVSLKESDSDGIQKSGANGQSTSSSVRSRRRR